MADSTISGGYTDGIAGRARTQLSDKVMTGEFAIAGYIVAVVVTLLGWLLLGNPGFAFGGLLGAFAALIGNCVEASSYGRLAPVRIRTPERS